LKNFYPNLIWESSSIWTTTMTVISDERTRE
jgi:hypothetical protein